MSMTQTTLIFDGDCAFCTRCAVWGASNLSEFPTAKAFQNISPASYGLNDADVRKSVWIIDGRVVLSGARAVAWILKAQPKFFWRIVGRFIDWCPIRPISAAAYRLVAINRHRMPGGTANCKVANLETDK